MKSAEQWYSQLTDTLSTETALVDIQDIEDIQQDAIAEGLRRAKEIATGISDMNLDYMEGEAMPQFVEYEQRHVGALHVAEAIQTEIDKLKGQHE